MTKDVDLENCYLLSMGFGNFVYHFPHTFSFFLDYLVPLLLHIYLYSELRQLTIGTDKIFFCFNLPNEYQLKPRKLCLEAHAIRHKTGIL